MEPVEAPVAWYYELAGYRREDGVYIHHAACLSFNKPNVPPESIRNLTPLYKRPPDAIPR